MKKIKLECWWTDSKSLTHRFINQFVPEIDEKKYQFVYEQEDYDYVIIFGKTNWENIKASKDNVLFFSQEPLWSVNESKEIHHYSNKIYIADNRVYPKHDSYHEILLPMFYGAKGESDNRDDYTWSKKIFNLDMSKNKNKDVSMVVTKNYNSHYDYLNNSEYYEIIYKKRTDLGIYLSEFQKEIDIWGVYWENNNKNLHGEAWNKRIAINNYKFSICCENTIQKNYISEKFWDCILTDTVPIYLGSNNVSDYIEDNSFIYINSYKNSIDDMAYIIRDVVNNANSLYKQYLPKIKNLKKEFIHGENYNLWNKIKSQIL